MIRHGRTDWNRDTRVMGKKPVPLSGDGVGMVEELAAFLAREDITRIYSGTLRRTGETARILASAWGAEIIEEPRLDESGYDKWVGMRYSELAGDPDFEMYQKRPTLSNFSSAEGMKDIQRRGLDAVARIQEESDGQRAALVSHSDVIKPVIAHFLGMDLDAMHRLAISNASVSLLDTEIAHRPRFRYINLVPWRMKKVISGKEDRPGGSENRSG